MMLALPVAGELETGSPIPKSISCASKSDPINTHCPFGISCQLSSLNGSEATIAIRKEFIFLNESQPLPDEFLCNTNNVVTYRNANNISPLVAKNVSAEGLGKINGFAIAKIFCTVGAGFRRPIRVTGASNRPARVWPARLEKAGNTSRCRFGPVDAREISDRFV